MQERRCALLVGIQDEILRLNAKGLLAPVLVDMMLANFEDYTDVVFEEVTGMSEEDVRFLRYPFAIKAR